VSGNTTAPQVREAAVSITKSKSELIEAILVQTRRMPLPASVHASSKATQARVQLPQRVGRKTVFGMSTEVCATRLHLGMHKMIWNQKSRDWKVRSCPIVNMQRSKDDVRRLFLSTMLCSFVNSSGGGVLVVFCNPVHILH